jgi:hypothetical protein
VIVFGRPTHDPPDPARGLRAGTPLHVFKKARLPREGRPAGLSPPTRVRVEHPRRDPAAPPPPRPVVLQWAVTAGGAVWIAASIAEAFLDRWYFGLAGAGVGAFALAHARDIGLTRTDARLPDSRRGSLLRWWLVPLTSLLFVAWIARVIAAR